MGQHWLANLLRLSIWYWFFLQTFLQILWNLPHLNKIYKVNLSIVTYSILQFNNYPVYQLVHHLFNGYNVCIMSCWAGRCLLSLLFLLWYVWLLGFPFSLPSIRLYVHLHASQLKLVPKSLRNPSTNLIKKKKKLSRYLVSTLPTLLMT